MTDSKNLAPIRRALISVSDKTQLVEFAQALHQFNIEILSTGGTFKLLSDNGIPAIEVADYTGFPEMMDGRVKTLHPKIHGGILGRRGVDDQTMAEHDINAIDMVVVNLYPFEQTVAKPDCSLEEAVENIDIGGPTMVRAAAKNHRDVAVVVSPASYTDIVDALRENSGALPLQMRFDLAIKAYEHTAGYDGSIANYFGRLVGNGSNKFPRTFNLQLIKSEELRYGENPHQQSAFYLDKTINGEASIASAVQLQGRELSYNNIADTDAALETVKQFAEPTCVIVKHANPCGVASADDITQAYERAFATDSESAFGGIIAFNRELDAATAQAICDRQFVEVIIVPRVSEAALAITQQRENVRVLSCGEWSEALPALDYKRVNGGLLVQDRDMAGMTEQQLKIVSKRQPTADEVRDLLFAWKVAKFVKSNAIVYAKNLQTIGVGAGQMSRVNSARIAAIKAEHAKLAVAGSVMASDAFFPFRDGIDNAAQAGIRCVIQPGGSIRDNEVIAAADEHDMAMVFTGIRHFRH